MKTGGSLMPPSRPAAEWVRTVPLDCPHPEAREVYVCYDCAAANLDAYASQQVEAALERAAQIAEEGYGTLTGRAIAAAIRALKETP